MANYDTGNYRFPVGEGHPAPTGSEMMPFISQMAMMQALAQKGRIGQQTAATQQAPPGYIPSKLSPNEMAPEYVNPQAGASEEQAKNAMRSSESFNKAMNVVRVAFPVMKGAYSQQGGQSGMIPGMAAQTAATFGLPNTFNISSLHQAFNDVTANVAQQYSGNQGISRLFQVFGGGTPTVTDSEQNAFGKLVTAAKTAYGIEKGVANAGWTNDQLRTLDPNTVQKTLGDPNRNYTQEEGRMIEKIMAEEYWKTEPTNLPNPKTGQVSPLQPNILNRGLNAITKGISSIIPGMAGSSNDPLEGRYASGPGGRLQRKGGQWVPAT